MAVLFFVGSVFPSSVDVAHFSIRSQVATQCEVISGISFLLVAWADFPVALWIPFMNPNSYYLLLLQFLTLEQKKVLSFTLTDWLSSSFP